MNKAELFDEIILTVRRRLRRRPGGHSNAGAIAVAAMEWVAAGEPEVLAPVLAALPDGDRQLVLNEARRVGQVLRNRDSA